MFEAKQLEKTYIQAEKSLCVLQGIDLEIKDSDVLTVVGPSGAGKSTLLHILGGLDRPTNGQVFLDGKDIYALNDGELARLRNTKIGFIFQFYYLLPEFSALENVIVPALIKNDYDSDEKLREKGLELLDQVGLKDRATHKPNQLSGGEQQRVAIARALINEPRVLLCDEPTGNLDSVTEKEIIDLLFRLNRDNGQTLVIVTHDENIANLSNSQIRLVDGKLVEQLTIEGGS